MFRSVGEFVEPLECRQFMSAAPIDPSVAEASQVVAASLRHGRGVPPPPTSFSGHYIGILGLHNDRTGVSVPRNADLTMTVSGSKMTGTIVIEQMGTFKIAGKIQPATGKFHVFFNKHKTGQILGAIDSTLHLRAKFDNDAIRGPMDGGALRMHFDNSGGGDLTA